MRHIIHPAAYFAILALTVLAVVSAIVRSRGRNVWWRWNLAVLTALVQGWFLYTGNPFLDDMGGAAHIDAYTTSIMNTLALTPFELYSSSIYGHHGLFYLIPVRMLHVFGFGTWTSVTMVTALIGFITFLVEYRCVGQMIDNDAVYTIAVLANAIVSFQIYSNQYYQVMPHRYLFQAVILYGCIIAFRKPQSILTRIVMWILAGAAILWNAETGMVVTVVWVLAAIYLDGRQKGKYTVKAIALNICYMAMAFLGGYCLINLYNLCVGGNTISLSTYIYPLGSRNYQVVDLLQVVLPSPVCGYFLVISVMLGVIGLYVRYALSLRMNERQYTVFLAAVMGLGVFTYYMNRAVTTNATIAGLPFILSLAYLCDRVVPDIQADAEQGKRFLFKKIRDNITVRNAVCVMCIVVLSGMALASLSGVGATVKNKTVTTWETDSLSDFLAEAEKKIPDDAAAYGFYTAQLYALLERETGIYLADFEDLVNQESVDYLKAILEKNQYRHIVVGTSFQGPERYISEKEYRKSGCLKYNDAVFVIYEKIE